MDHHVGNPIIHQVPPGPITLSQEEAQSKLQNFRRVQPVILGVSQVVIGLMNISLLIMSRILLFHSPLRYVFEILYYALIMGPSAYIISGILSVVTGKKVTKNMICGSLGLNALSAAIAGVKIVILSFLALVFDTDLSDTKFYLWGGIVTVKLILTLLELYIAVSLSAFGCNAVCCVETPVVVNLSTNEQELYMHGQYYDYEEMAFPAP